MTDKEKVAAIAFFSNLINHDAEAWGYEQEIPIFKTALEALTRSDWTPCAEGLPESEKQVLLTCVSENKRTYECKGYYLAKHSKEIGCADDLESDYDEETDRNYCPEGFYECIENWGDYSFVYINDTVLAWQPLPEPYNPNREEDANDGD